MKQQRFKSMPRPPRPTIRHERVAMKIAKRIISEVNLDDFYWKPSELPDIIEDVAFEIMRCGRPATVFGRLLSKQPLASCNGERITHPYGWEGIDDHCRYIADDIAAEELQAAIETHNNLMGINER